MNQNKEIVYVQVKEDLFLLGVGTFKAGVYPAQQSCFQKNYWTVQVANGLAKDVHKNDCKIAPERMAILK